MPDTVRYELQQVGFDYAGVCALDAIDGAIGRGAIVGVLGPNGSGKSTLLRLLARLARPQRGAIRFDARPLDSYSPEVLARRTAWVPQQSSVLYPLRVRDLVALGRTPYARGFGFETAADREVIAQVIATMGIGDLADRPVETLSGGQRQRVLIAARLAQRPEVLLLDEPLAHLDLAVGLELMVMLRTLVLRQGLTVVFAGHDLNLAATFCDQLWLLDRGRLVASGTSETVLTVAALRSVYRCETVVDQHPTTGRPRVTWVPP